MKKLPLLLLLLVPACTDAEWSGLQSYGSAARITCYSGGKVIYDACSTGKILDATGSDGYILDDAFTHRHVQVSGQCLIDYAAPCPEQREHQALIEKPVEPPAPATVIIPETVIKSHERKSK